MKVTTDMTLVKKGQKYGRITSLIGLTVLVGGLVYSLVQIQQGLGSGSFMISTLSMLIGFILSNVGIFLANRWVKEPRADQALEKVLKSFDNRYRLYNYVLPTQHVLLTPAGLIVLLPKLQDGTISVTGSRWRRKMNVGRLLRFFIEEGIGNPTKEALNEEGLLRKFLASHAPDVEVPIATLIVFTADEDKLNLTVENPDLPVLQLGDLKEEVRTLGKSRDLASATYRHLTQVFDEAAGN